jgi:hypothetical protein
MPSFKEAFAKARKEKGAGKTFTWNGKSYSTNQADDKKKSKPTEKSTTLLRSAPKKAATSKTETTPASSSRPKARPTSISKSPVQSPRPPKKPLWMGTAGGKQRMAAALKNPAKRSDKSRVK